MTFEEFLDQELAGLRRYAQVLVGNRQDAQDVLADALLRAHTGWSRIAAMQFPTAYVRRMVTSTFLSERRRWSTRQIRLTSTGVLPDRAGVDPAGSIDDRDQLHQLLAGLPPRQRAAIVLRFYLDLSDAQIATELGITAGAVRTAVSRALAALRVNSIAGSADPAPVVATQTDRITAGKGTADQNRTRPDPDSIGPRVPPKDEGEELA